MPSITTIVLMKPKDNMAPNLERINNNLPFLVSYLDRDLKYTYVNQKYADWFGLPIEDIIGKNAKDLIGMAAYNKIEHHLNKALMGEFVTYETSIPYSTREPVFVKVNLVPDTNENGETQGITTTVADFSAIENNFAKLSTLDKAKTEFLKIISHELNTPLNGIIGFSSLLKENLEGTSEEELVDHILESSERLLKLTNTALLITQLNGKTYEIKARPGNLSELINRLVNQGDKYRDEFFKIEIGLPKELPQVCFEPGLIIESVHHLISNAKKHTEKNTKLHISHIETETEIQIVFNDDGPGFTKEYLNYLFEFFASFDSSKVADKRYGLGLAFIKLVMEAHDGQITLKNNMEGGACIMLHFQKFLCPARN